jgi:hypothetical protein
MTPDELAEKIMLPAHLAKSPYLREFYGKVSWSARSMHSGAMGWFSGDSADLQPLTVKEQARMIADIAGGEARLLDHARRYVETGNPRAALELSGHAIPKASADIDKRVGIRFTGTGEAFTIHVHRGVAEIIPGIAGDLDMLVRADSLKWKEMIGKLRSPVTTLASFDYPKGNAVAFALFLKLFEAPPIRLPFENKDN